MDVISIIMAAGKSSVDVALYTLLPIMVIMLIIMKYLEVRGILDVIVRWVAPLLKPFGLTGMSAFALIQINFVSFAAPLATLAMVFAMGQGNVFYPLTPFGLHWLASIVISVVGGLCAAAVAWHVTGRRLSVAENPRAEALPNAEQNSQGILAVINSAGSDAIRLALGAVPMLILSLTIVGLLQGAGAIDLLQQLLKPLLSWLHIPQNFVLPALVKCVAGGTAYFGVISELIQQGKVTVDQVNASAGLLIQTFDLPGIGIFLGISSRFVRLFRFVAPAAIVGILLRTVLHLTLF
ncbi:nucleoside recognition domain-containing protein [Klebsiella pneumoniae]|uniref:nucleoside recognition domain-containing protein n=1 Tax=Klebsiella pneumoniae TaxID=573 RepID=UPI000808E7B3|nr:nucleoside recognition domain-containing protein [Klebsiella pneumoniae]MBC4493346.1 nucleoside recognition family protein [Klebsiella pneumoniae]MBK2662493.1 nucleoside recognition family protein [Klebsiella pneumoniae]MBK3121964.1 nucleoside recognition family protein [Klebsiella pneumoniae]MCB3305360.1 nucleoside recognition family protein [Klebsiella pneumoniae]MCE7340947.1 nucleoside recognition family protein [Klebsiella pneumoniae]